MTTNKQLQLWLARFPDDTLVEVLTSSESRGGYYTDVNVYHEDLVLPDVTMSTLKGYDDFSHVVFDVVYDYDKEVATNIKLLTLGKAHND